jgi:hypothetical protein
MSMLKRTELMKVTVQATVQVGAAKPIAFGWEAKFEPSDAPEKVVADIDLICRRVRDEAQETAR